MNQSTTRALAIAVVASTMTTLPAMVIGQSPPQTTVIFKSQTTSAGEPITFPTQNTEVTGSIGVRPPGWVGDWHRHPYPRFHYILEGTFTVEYETGETKSFSAGSLSVEPINVWHRPKNIGSIPAKWLFIDSAEAGKANVTPRGN